MGWLDDTVALVTGGASGLGYAVVEQYIKEGAKVGLLDVDEEALDLAAEEFGSDIVTVAGDVTEYQDNERAVEQTVDAFGRLDVLVANAGLFDEMVGLSDLSGDQITDGFRELFEVNVLGYLLSAKAALPELIESEGRIVVSASHASFHPDGGGILYVPSKHAVAGIVRQLAFELAPTIRVNGVAPAYVPTNLSGLESLQQKDGIIAPSEFDPKNHPLEFVPNPSDYTGPYVLLASEKYAKPMTGTIIRADLGRSVRGIGT